MARETRQTVRVNVRLRDVNAARGLRDVGRTGAKAGQSITASFVKAQIAFAAIAGAARRVQRAISDMVFGVTDRIDEIAKMAKRVGVSTEAISELGFAADLSGTSLSTLQRALRNIARSAKQVEDGTGKATGAFAELGVKVTNADGSFRAADDILLDLADTLGQMEDAGRQTALSLEVLGERAGPELLPLLKSGSEGIRAMRERARELGLSVDKLTAEQFEALKDSVTEMDAAFEGMKRQIAIELAPVLTDMFREIADFVAENKDEFIDFIKLSARAFGGLAKAVNMTVGGFRILKELADGEHRPGSGIIGDFSGVEEIGREIRATNRDIDDLIDSITRIGSTDPLNFDFEGGKPAEHPGDPYRHLREAREAAAEAAQKDMARLADGASWMDRLGPVQDDRTEFEITERLREKVRLFPVKPTIDEDGIRELDEQLKAAISGSTRTGGTEIKLFEPERVRSFGDGAREAVEHLEALTSEAALGREAIFATSDAFGSFFDAVTTGSQSAADAMRQMASDILSSLGRLLAQRAFTQLLGGALGAVGLGPAEQGPSVNVNVAAGADSAAVEAAARRGVEAGYRTSQSFVGSTRAAARGGLN